MKTLLELTVWYLWMNLNKSNIYLQFFLPVCDDLHFDLQL